MIHELTALEQARAIREGELTSLAIVEHYLERIAALNEQVGAYIRVTPDVARAQAKRADEQQRSGAELGELHGVIVPVKDLNLVAGIPTTFGSATLNLTAPMSDAFVRHLEHGHTVMIGKTNTPEFGLPCYTEPEVAAPARSPWDLTRSAGGSSGGAGAAVAAGLAPVAHGSDGGGSIRIPASACGLVGIKPSRGRITNAPFGDSIGELAVHGPLARTVADAAALLDLMSGNIPGDHFIAPEQPRDFLIEAGLPPGRLRIGCTRDPVIIDTQLDPEVIQAFDDVTQLLTELGHEVIDISLNVPGNLVDGFETVWSSLAASLPLDPQRESQLRPLTQWLRERGRSYSAVHLASAVNTLRQTTRQLLHDWHDLDVVLMPTLAKLPAPVGGIRNDADPAADFAAQKAFTPFTALVNMTGQPAINMPVFWTEHGIPVGVQFVGKPFQEGTLIRLAAQIEQARPWYHRYQELWHGTTLGVG